MKVSFDELNWQYSLDDLDSFKDLPHLVNLTLQKIRSNIPGATAYFFVLQPEFHEYREVVREGRFSIPEESDLVTYLAIKNEIIYREDLSKEKFFKDIQENVWKFLFSKELEINIIVPVVYRFRLLGFIMIALDKKVSTKSKIKQEQKQFLKLLKETLKVSLFAAILIDKRFYELLTLVDLTKKMKQYELFEDVIVHICELTATIVNFDCGVFYEFDPFDKKLYPRSTKAVEKPLVLQKGESISGYVFEKRKPLIASNIKENVFFNELNHEDFVKRSFLSVPFLSSVQDFGVLTIANNKKNEEFSVDHLYLLRIVSSVIVGALENKMLYQRLEKSYFETVSSLASALEAKDPYTKGHSERVMKYSVGIAEELELPRETIRDIKYAAILHDIGKIAISESIISKPGRLTNEEYQVIQSHPEIGAEILNSVDFLQRAKIYVHYHHEKMDGTGYYKMRKEDIPWETRIIVLADSFDALTSDRPYRRAIHPEIALRELKKSIDHQFEKKIFDAFVRYLKSEKIVRESLIL